MNKISDLIAKHCPNGVEFKHLKNVGTWYGGGTPSKSKLEYWQNGTIPWLSPKDMGKPVIEITEDYITVDAVSGSATKLVPANSVAIVVRSSILDKTLPAALVPMPVTLNQDMKAVVAHDGILPPYIAHVLRARGADLLRATRKTGGSVASIEVPKLMAFRIPIPPLEIQKEIVRVLNSLTVLEAELKAELEAELEARRKQFSHYRNNILIFNENIGGGVTWRKMAEIGTFVRGNGLQKKDFVDSGIGCIHYGQIHTHYGTSADKTKSYISPELAKKLRKAHTSDLVIATTSENDEDVCKAVAWLGKEDIAVSGDAYIYRHSLNPKYAAYFFQTEHFQKQKKTHISGTKVRRVSGESMGKFLIPVPPMEEQNRIVSILDKFGTLVSDISDSLPAEITARRQQYEYYCNQLLTFQEAA